MYSSLNFWFPTPPPCRLPMHLGEKAILRWSYYGDNYISFGAVVHGCTHPLVCIGESRLYRNLCKIPKASMIYQCTRMGKKLSQLIRLRNWTENQEVTGSGLFSHSSLIHSICNMGIIIITLQGYCTNRVGPRTNSDLERNAFNKFGILTNNFCYLAKKIKV